MSLGRLETTAAFSPCPCSWTLPQSGALAAESQGPLRSVMAAAPLSALELVKACLSNRSAHPRHLLLVAGDAEEALQFLREVFAGAGGSASASSAGSAYSLVCGNDFTEDASETSDYLLVSEILSHMEKDVATSVLWSCSRIYESLYELLNNSITVD